MYSSLIQETDKAMMDVEADEDGMMAKILAPSGTKDVEVNKLIAYLAEQDDDLSSLELPSAEEPSNSKQSASKEADAPQDVPKKDSKEPSPSKDQTPSEGHKHATFGHTPLPSVLRLAQQYGIEQPEKEIKGTGLHGILTKGDVLAFLGKAGSPFGTASGKHTKLTDLGAPPSKDTPAQSRPKEPLTADEERDLILSGLVQLSTRKTSPGPTASFETLLSAYKPPHEKPEAKTEHATPGPSAKSSLDQLYADLLR